MSFIRYSKQAVLHFSTNEEQLIVKWTQVHRGAQCRQRNDINPWYGANPVFKGQGRLAWALVQRIC
jgi:hypothetical protein